VDCSLYSTVLMKIYIQNIRQGFSQFSEQENLDYLAEPNRSIYHSPATIKVEVDRDRRRIRAQLRLETRANRVCDDCLTEFQDEIKLETTRVFVLGGDELSKDLDVVTLPADARELNLTPIIDEMILLNHPMKVLCKPDCKGLCPRCGVNLNVDKCRCEESSGDPRWAELKNLLK